MPSRHPEFESLSIFTHPLIQHKLTWLRDEDTGHRAFRALVAQMAGLMTFELTRELPIEPVRVRTPMEHADGHRLAAAVTVVPVLRAGLGMAEGVMEVMPEARVGHVGMARDETSLEPTVYLKRLPTRLDAGPVILVDPMLATGGSASAAISILRAEGARDLRLMCLVAAPEGVRRLARDHPGVPAYAAALDDRLDEHGFIRPGLGDAGDRMYGTT